MKQLTCEMCGSTDLLKQDGVFVCQACGCKYSVEEAKKMMVEGVVDVSGSTVKVDTSAELANLYQIARRAKDDNNSENAAKYYDMILVKDPFSWEAAFYVVYFKALSCKIAHIQSAAVSLSNCQGSILELIYNHVPEEKQENAVREVMLRSATAARMLANGATNHYNGISSNIKNQYTQECIDNVCAARDIMYTCGTEIERIFATKTNIAKLAAEAWKVGISIHTEIMPLLANKDINQRTIQDYVKKIGKYDPTYTQNHDKKEKIEKLRSEIAELDKIISSTPTEHKMGCLGIFLISTGCIMIILSMMLLSMGESVGWYLIIGIGELALGILAAIPNKELLNQNIAKVEEAERKRAEKKKEIKLIQNNQYDGSKPISENTFDINKFL